MNTNGRFNITWFPKDNPQLYFKNPEILGYEYAFTSFMRRLGKECLPFCELFAFYSKIEGVYPILVASAHSYINNFFGTNGCPFFFEGLVRIFEGNE
jgi:hypothetical protein